MFVNGHIIGMDEWNINFSPNYLDGLSSTIWIRMPKLPLYYWDEVNVARIESLVGTLLLIDGNMFQSSRREFGRVHIQVKLDK